jgi:hypothetical protein
MEWKVSDDIFQFSHKWCLGVLAEYGHHRVQHNLQLLQVSAGGLDENVFGGQSYFRVLAVDDGRQGAHDPVGIVNDRVQWLIPDDGQILAQVAVFLERRETSTFKKGIHPSNLQYLRRIPSDPDRSFPYSG